MSKHTPDTRCAAKVWPADGRGGTHYRCSRTATVVEGGSGYCKQHAPSSVKARRDKWNAKYEAESKARDEKWAAEERRERRRDQCESALSGIPDPAAFVKAARELAAAAEHQELLFCLGPSDRDDGDEDRAAKRISDAIAAFHDAADAPARGEVGQCQ